MFFHTFHPSPLIIDFGFVAVRWYGFLISLSVVVCFFIGKRLFRRYNLPGQLFFDLAFYLLVFGFIGARLWHILSEFSYYSSHLLDIFKIWQGGLAIHGALLAGALVVYFYYQKHRQLFAGISWLLLLDIFAPLIALGQAIGRFGNYFNQELYGRPVEWGIPIDLANRLSGYENYKYFHPIFLYESLWCLMIFILLIILHRRHYKINHQPSIINHQSSISAASNVTGQMSVVKCQLSVGAIFFLYLILYSLGRFFIGFLRIDPQTIWLNLRLDQWVSVILFMVGIILFIRRSYHHQLKNKSPQKS